MQIALALKWFKNQNSCKKQQKILSTKYKKRVAINYLKVFPHSTFPMSHKKSFFSFTLYDSYSGVRKENPVLRHSIPHFPPAKRHSVLASAVTQPHTVHLKSSLKYIYSYKNFNKKHRMYDHLHNIHDPSTNLRKIQLAYVKIIYFKNMPICALD